MPFNRSVMLRARAILPGKYKDPEVVKAVEKEAKKINKDIVKSYKDLMKWKKQPKFTEEVRVDGSGVTNRVYTDNEIFRYQDEGTKRHFVAPKKKKALHWPGVRGSGKGAGRGRPRQPKAGFFSKGHWVGGIKAKNYTDTIYKEWSSKYILRMTAVFDQAIKVMEETNSVKERYK